MLQTGIKNDDREAGNDPGPGANGVMRDVEPQHREQTLLLIARAEDALRDVAPAPWLCARIPERPPLQPDEHKKVRDRDHPQRLGREASRKFREGADPT